MKNINWFWVKENIGKPAVAIAVLLGTAFVLGMVSVVCSKLFMAGWQLFS